MSANTFPNDILPREKMQSCLQAFMGAGRHLCRYILFILLHTANFAVFRFFFDEKAGNRTTPH
jgi:hypothetical protein